MDLYGDIVDSEHHEVVSLLDDTTTINGEHWSEVKAVMMQPDYENSEPFKALHPDEQGLVKILIFHQGLQGKSSVEPLYPVPTYIAKEDLGATPDRDQEELAVPNPHDPAPFTNKQTGKTQMKKLKVRQSRVHDLIRGYRTDIRREGKKVHRTQGWDIVYDASSSDTEHQSSGFSSGDSDVSYGLFKNYATHKELELAQDLADEKAQNKDPAKGKKLQKAIKEYGDNNVGPVMDAGKDGSLMVLDSHKQQWLSLRKVRHRQILVTPADIGPCPHWQDEPL